MKYYFVLSIFNDCQEGGGFLGRMKLFSFNKSKLESLAMAVSAS